MKVTTELKRLITLRFEELKSERNKKIKEEADAIYKSKVAEIEASPEWKDYVSASERLYKYLEPDYKEIGTKYSTNHKDGSAYHYYDLSYLKQKTATTLVCENQFRYVNVHGDVSDLNNQRDKLLIKLTYEKKLENIEAMLAEYGIKL